MNRPGNDRRLQSLRGWSDDTTRGQPPDPHLVEAHMVDAHTLHRSVTQHFDTPPRRPLRASADGWWRPENATVALTSDVERIARDVPTL